MNIEYFIDKNQLLKINAEILISRIKIFCVLYFFIAGIYGFSLITKSETNLNWSDYLSNCIVFFVLIFIVYFLIPAVISRYKLSRIINDTNYSLSQNSFSVINDTSAYQIQLSSLEKIYQLNDHYILNFQKNLSIPIPKEFVTKSILIELNSFLPKNNIFKWIYAINFIPNIGLLSGIYYIIRGITNKNYTYILWGTIGLVFTPIFWDIYSNSDYNKKNKILTTKFYLNETKKDLIYYKYKFGRYPDSLSELKKINPFSKDDDAISNDFSFFGNSKINKLIYKKVTDSTYYLKSLGIDRKDNTKDDIYPDL